MDWFLLGALTKCTDVLSGKSPQVAYRLSLVRAQLSLDQLPTADAIMHYSEHLQAEAEELVINVQSKASSALKAAALGVNGGNVAPPPGIPQQEIESKPQRTQKGACKYWMTEKGFNRGDQCRFHHSTLDPKSGRCFNCSGDWSLTK